MLPDSEVPERTEGYEGFYHLMNFEGTVEKQLCNTLFVIMIKQFELRKKRILEIRDDINAHFENYPVKVDISDQYFNMAEKYYHCLILLIYLNVSLLN